MITFDSLTLKAWVEENMDFLTNSRIQKIQQPTRRDLIFSIRNNGETKKLYININPQFHHICFMNKENETRRMIEIPQKPPMFCMLLRKYLENSRIAKINQPPYERILEFYIETFNELSEKIYPCLAIELMGKHSNVVLYNYDTNIILGCAHNVGSDKSREREMAGTLPYIYPPKQKKTDILNFNGNLDYENMPENFFWISKAFANQCKGKSLEDIKNFIRLKNISPAISNDFKEYSLFENLLQNPIKQNSINEMLDNYYTYYVEKDKLASLSHQLTSIISPKLKKDKNSLSKMEKQLNYYDNSDKYRVYGDLIMANLYNNKDYSKNIIVFNYEENKEITINLDDTKTLKENANKFYKLYNKGKTSKLKLSELIQTQKTDISYLEQILYSIKIANNISELLEIKSEIDIKLGNTKTTAAKKSAIEPLKLDIDGFNVFVGKNNRQNDYIVSKLSKDDDYWFHTRNCAGSHVLLQCQKPTDELLYKCAKLAKEYSSAKNSSKVGIIYTKRKNLKKPPKANPGYVTYKNEQEIIVD